MGHRRRLIPVVAAVAMLVASGCEPQMEIHLSLRRTATIGTVDGLGLRPLELRGLSECTRDEPVDLFPTVTQGSVVDRPGELSVPCGPVRAEWTQTFSVDGAIGPGPARIDITACTNPAEPIDEDCVSLSRVVDIGAAP